MRSPHWKLRREIKRLIEKPKNIRDLIFAPSMQRNFDRLEESVKHRGKGQCFPDVAILLLYAPEGVPDDYYRMLDYLESNSITSVIVSQLSLDKHDLKKLCSRAHLIIERPNFGYDFGGYREGILTVLDMGYSLRNLFVVNDSIWFPLHSDSDLIEVALKDPSDLYGIYFNDQRKKADKHHLQSYFYRFGANLCRHNDFQTYWRNLVTYNNKDLTVRRNEMKLTNWFRSRGHKIGYRYDTKNVKQVLLELTVSERKAVAEYQISIGDKYAGHVREKLSSNAYADDAIYATDVEAGILGRYFLISHPAVLIDKLKCPVLKRDQKYPYQLQRSVLLTETCSEKLPPSLLNDMSLATTIDRLEANVSRLAFAPKPEQYF